MQKLWNWIRRTIEESPEWFARHWRSLAVMILASLASATICQNPFQSGVPLYEVGQMSKENIRADQSIRVVDEELTDKKRQQASEQVLDVFDFDPTAKQSDLESTLKAFRLVEGKEPSHSEKIRKAFEDAIE